MTGTRKNLVQPVLLALTLTLIHVCACSSAQRVNLETQDSGPLSAVNPNEQRVKDIYAILREKGGVRVVDGTFVLGPMLGSNKPRFVLIVGDVHKPKYQAKNKPLIVWCGKTFGVITLVPEGRGGSEAAHRWFLTLMQPYRKKADANVLPPDELGNLGLDYAPDVAEYGDNWTDYASSGQFEHVTGGESKDARTLFDLLLCLDQMKGLEFISDKLKVDGAVVLMVDETFTIPAVSRMFASQHLLRDRFGEELPFLKDVKTGTLTSPDGKEHTMVALKGDDDKAMVAALLVKSNQFFAKRMIRDRNVTVAHRAWEYLLEHPEEDILIVVFGVAHLMPPEVGIPIPTIANCLARLNISSVSFFLAPITVKHIGVSFMKRIPPEPS